MCMYLNIIINMSGRGGRERRGPHFRLGVRGLPAAVGGGAAVGSATPRGPRSDFQDPHNFNINIDQI